MVEYRRRKGAAGYVTGTAVLIGYNVVRLGILAGCIDTIVAGNAALANNARAGVIDKRSREICRVMTD
jgi:hypothetical protein